ncbi:MAG: hypothetical protein AB1656_03885 [Candidatus Omnitrophota bacterium]
MSAAIDALLILAFVGLGLWTLHLKAKVRELEREIASRPPELPSFSAADLRKLQAAMAHLVEEVEVYAESQLKKMQVQTQAMSELCGRLEAKLKELEEPALVPESAATRIVPLSTKQPAARHHAREKVIDLHKQGWPMEKIAEELRITKGEVQLIVNLC